MIDFYALTSPNVQKIFIMLEECELPYNIKTVDVWKGDQFTPEFTKINPLQKVPAIVDSDGPGGKPYTVIESGAILIYLGQKSGKFWPRDPRAQNEVLQWLFFQVGGVGPMFGQFGHFFKYAKDKCKDPYPVERYTNEAKRLLAVLDRQLSDREYLVEEYTIADIATFPWVNGLGAAYGADQVLPISEYPHVEAWLARCKARPAYERGKDVTSAK